MAQRYRLYCFIHLSSEGQWNRQCTAAEGHRLVYREAQGVSLL